MTFLARIKQFSPVWRLWREHARVGGQLQGVLFAWEPGNVYRSNSLTEDQIAALRDHDSVVMEVVSAGIPAAPVVVAAPVAVVAPAAKPVAAPARPAVVNATRPGRR